MGRKQKLHKTGGERKLRRQWLKKKPVIIGGAICLATVVGFLTWLFISALTAEASLEVVTTYAVPEFNDLGGLPSLDYGEYAVAVDGTVVSASADEVRPTASTAKMILGLAVMREKPFAAGEKGETITITDEMYNRYVWYVNNGGSTTKVVVGEEITEYDALASVFLPSSNNMADALAVWAFGSLDAYREYATGMLAEWGLANTTIGVDASGFDASTTSTAAELAVIGQKVLENEVLREIVGLKEYEVPVAGTLTNTNKTLGVNRIVGVKTGYIGDASGYCLVSGYLEGEHIITTALLGAPSRTGSFNDSLQITVSMQNTVQETAVFAAGDIVGYYESWWAGQVPIYADEDLQVVGWKDAAETQALEMDGLTGALKLTIGGYDYEIPVHTDEFALTPSFGDRLSHSFGWKNDRVVSENSETESDAETEGEEFVAEQIEEEKTATVNSSSAAASSGNCTLGFGNLMLINPNFTVDTNFIAARQKQLISVSATYGIIEGNPYNGDNLMDAEAAAHLNEMVKAYEAEYPGHTFETRSCFRARGTTCGRLCAATGASDHHTGLTCDLLDPQYGTSLDTSTYAQHIDWQWLYANSYKYGFIDRFPEEWAGGSMSEPLNVDENGSTGLFETWHYRYVGVGPATEIATGKYNNGAYDSLEHYLKARGMVTDLKNGKCN